MIRLTASLNRDLSESVAIDEDISVELPSGNYWFRVMVRNDDPDVIWPNSTSIVFDGVEEVIRLTPWVDGDKSYGVIAEASKTVRILGNHEVSVIFGDETLLYHIVPPSPPEPPEEDFVLNRFKTLGLDEEKAAMVTKRWNGELLTFEEAETALEGLRDLDVSNVSIDELDSIANVAEEIRARRDYILTAEARLRNAVTVDG